MKEKNTPKRKGVLGKDEMNFAEFPLALIGKRAPANVKTLHFVDETTDRATGRRVERRLTVSAADVLGLPTGVDDEVMLGCLQLSFRSGFTSPKVPFKRSEFLELLGWKRSGHHYRRLADSLRKWKGTLIISENGFWDKGEKRWVNDSFSLLDRVYIAGRGSEESGRDEECYFVWGDFMWKSIEAGNLRTLDFEFIKSLESNVSKRLYRWLGKRFYHQGTVTIDLKRLAFEKIGFSRSMHTGQIKEKLAAAHAELASRGFLRWEYQQLGRGRWQVVYQQVEDTAPPKAQTPPQPTHAEQLLQRGVEHPGNLVNKYPPAHIEQAIANYDDRRSHGELIEPGWLVRSITSGKPIRFRRGYQANAKATDWKQRQEDLKKERTERESRHQAARSAERERFATFLVGLSDKGRGAFEVKSLCPTTMEGKVFAERLRRCEPEKIEGVKQEAMFALWLRTQRSRQGRR